MASEGDPGDEDDYREPAVDPITALLLEYSDVAENEYLFWLTAYFESMRDCCVACAREVDYQDGA